MGRVRRMQVKRTPRRVMESGFDGTKRKGRPRVRWRDQVQGNLEDLGIAGWKKAAENKNGRK